MIDFSKMMRHCEAHPYRLVFATISGAHLYGFPSPDSDFDLRGTHVLPLPSVVGLRTESETVEKEGVYDDLEIDLVTHDIKKFVTLMLRRNGYVLEQLLSPHVVQTSSEHEELKAHSVGCITKHHAHHYLGFAATQWKLFAKESPPRVKPLLYVYRVLLTGIHLMQTGEVVASLPQLNQIAKLPGIEDLVQQKRQGAENQLLKAVDLAYHERQYQRLVGELEDAYRKSALPETPSSGAALNDFLVRTRMNHSE